MLQGQLEERLKQLHEALRDFGPNSQHLLTGECHCLYSLGYPVWIVIWTSVQRDFLPIQNELCAETHIPFCYGCVCVCVLSVK